MAVSWQATRSSVRSGVRCMTTSTAQQKQWEGQVRDGKVLNVSTKEAGRLLSEGWTLLDVRPIEEINKAAVEGAVHVPLFVLDPEGFSSLSGLIKQVGAVVLDASAAAGAGARAG